VGLARDGAGAFGQYVSDRFIPLYYQLENILRSKIEGGEVMPTTSFRRSRSCPGNTRSAAPRCDRPCGAGLGRLLYRKQGKGTFVTEKASQTKSVKLTGFTEDLFSEGHQPK